MSRREIYYPPDTSRLPTDPIKSLSRAAIATGLAASEGSIVANDYAQKTWAADRDVGLVLRSATSPASLANSPALAVIADAFLDALVPQSAGADLFNRALSLRFENRASGFRIPGLTLPNADFVDEAEPIPVQQALSNAVFLEPHKLAVIVTVTAELLRHPDAEDVIRAMLIEATGPAIDRVLLSAAPAAADRPAGILNGIPPLPTTGDLTDDLVAVVTALAPVAGNNQIAIIASPQQAAQINLRLPRAPRWPVLTSTALPTGAIVAVALPALVSAIAGAPQIDAAAGATVHMESEPAEVVDIGGVLARPVRSMFQSDTVGLRLRWRITWSLRDPRGVAWMKG